LSNSNHDGQDDPTGDDDGGQGAPSADPIIPNLIGSDMAAQVLPSAADQPTTISPLGSAHLKKKHFVLVSKRKQSAFSDQVTTELFPHHAPSTFSGFSYGKVCFSVTYFKLSNASLRLPGPTLQLGLTLSQPKDFGHHR
jgi:hypothetical protein